MPACGPRASAGWSTSRASACPTRTPEQAPDAPGQVAGRAARSRHRCAPTTRVDEVAARLRRNNPRLPADKAALARAALVRAARRRPLAHPRRPGAQAASTRCCIARRRCWPAGAASPRRCCGSRARNTDVAKFWGDRYPRAEFEARLAQVPQRRAPAAGGLRPHAAPRPARAPSRPRAAQLPAWASGRHGNAGCRVRPDAARPAAQESLMTKIVPLDPVPAPPREADTGAHRDPLSGEVGAHPSAWAWAPPPAGMAFGAAVASVAGPDGHRHRRRGRRHRRRPGRQGRGRGDRPDRRGRLLARQLRLARVRDPARLLRRLGPGLRLRRGALQPQRRPQLRGCRGRDGARLERGARHVQHGVDARAAGRLRRLGARARPARASAA